MVQIARRKTRVIRIGRVRIGGTNPVAIQSMTKTRTADTAATIRQIDALEAAGCEIVRLAVKDPSDATALAKIRKKTKMPLVADIHFDWRLALRAIDSGVDKIRLNPGNIFRREEVREIARAAKAARIPIRVGLNSGSLQKFKARRGRKDNAGLMVEAALRYLEMLEEFGFSDIVVSLKGSDMHDTLGAYRMMSERSDLPLHLGVTATGFPLQGLVKSSIAVGALLLEGIGDTIRISLTDKPEEEVKAARAILAAVNLRAFGPELVSCPTCGRCEVDLVGIVRDLEKRISGKNRKMKVAVMGCVVNGPGEAGEADIGIAFGKKDGLFFRKGRAIRKIAAANCLKELIKEIA